MSLLPENDKQRKMLPLFKQITRYFPKALRELTKVSVANNVRYNPGRDPADINWNRGKSTDQMGSLFRHMLEIEVDGKVFEELPPEVAARVGYDHVYVAAELAWRALAVLETAIEEYEAKTPGLIAKVVALAGTALVNHVDAQITGVAGTPPPETMPYSGFMDLRAMKSVTRESLTGVDYETASDCRCRAGEYGVYKHIGWRSNDGTLHTRERCYRPDLSYLQTDRPI